MFSALFSNRLIYPIFSREWCKAWLKRGFNFPALVRLIIVGALINKFGGKCGIFTIVFSMPRFKDLKNFKVGRQVSIAKNVHFALHEKIEIGDCVVISAGSKFYTASHDINHSSWPLVSRPIKIGDYVWIGSGAVILPGVSIGYGAVVGAGAVVAKDIPDFGVAVGNPAAIKSYRAGPFRYSPTAFSAPYECWVGTEISCLDGGL